ncbi:MAG: alpha/beta fold hydrolase [Granulosicoccus sp.]
MKQRYDILSFLCGIALISACSSNDNNSTDNSSDQNSTLVWQSCSDQSDLQCTTLEVLADPDDSESETITLALNRLPSIQEEREGIVLINPGGPGGSGVELLEELSAPGVLPQALREKFDFIGFDPRGVGGSTAVDCSEFGTTEINKYLANEQAIDQYMEELAATAVSCEQKYGAYLQQLGSQNVVHDMDAIRNATGEEQLHYLGYSYGTRLGALYLQTYPENSGHFILDGSLKPESDVEFLVSGAVEAFQASLVSLLDECSSISSDCNGTQLLETLENRVSALASEGSDEDLDIITVLLYFASENPALGPFLLPPLYDYLLTDDISELQTIYEDGLSELVDEGDDTLERAVMCADDATRPTVNDLRTLLEGYNEVSDIFAEINISQAGMCSGWPASLTELPLITTSQAPPALVIGGTTDTLTLVQWAEEMAQSIAGYYLESNHIGHTVVFNGSSSCVDSIAEEFLLTGLQPLETTCSPD